MNFYINFLANLINKTIAVKNDFVGFTIHWEGVFTFLASIIVSFIIIFLLYIIGVKIQSLLFKNRVSNKYNIFISIGLGYMVLGSGIALLGIFSLLYTTAILVFISLLFLFACYPYRHVVSTIKNDYRNIRLILKIPKPFLTLFLGGIIIMILAFLRTIPPESGVDAILYHLEYPKVYLIYHTIMIMPNNTLPFVTVPQLGQMLYVVTESIRFVPQAPRIIHFLFYLLIALFFCTLAYTSKTKYTGIFAFVIFITTSVINFHASTAYVDFPLIFCWMLSIFMLINKFTIMNVILSAFFFGGVLATKDQGLVFFPAFLIYIFVVNVKNKKKALCFIILFTLVAMIVPLLWYIRSFLLTGNPFYTEFNRNSIAIATGFWTLTTIKIKFLSIFMSSPLLLFGMPLLIYAFLQRKQLFTYSSLNLILLLFFITYIFLSTTFINGRYLLYLYIPFIIYVSPMIRFFYISTNFYRYGFLTIFFVMIIYYFINTLLILPYGFGWSDQNKYLSRILAKDNSSYFDYDRKFSRYIVQNDLVATYNLEGFYYADFHHADVMDLLGENKVKSNTLLEKKATKLIIRGGDIQWFCFRLQVRKCKTNYKLLAFYKPNFQYLYDLQ